MRSARRLWEDLRPLPRPRYLPNTPNIGGLRPDIFFPPTIPTLAEAALSREAADFVVGLLRKLEQNEETEGQEFFYLWGQGRFGKHWRYADITTMLCAAALAIRPKTYLEIGVRRGRSAAVVGALSPDGADRRLRSVAAGLRRRTPPRPRVRPGAAVRSRPYRPRYADFRRQ